MLSPKPWKLETSGRLLSALLICAFIGATISAVLGYDPAKARTSFRVCVGIGVAGMACLGAALVFLLGRWEQMNFRLRIGWLGVLAFAGLNLAVTAQHVGNSSATADPGLAVLVISTLSFHAAGLVLVGWLLRQEGQTWSEVFGLGQEPVLALVKGFGLSLLALPACWMIQMGCVWCLHAIHWEAKEQTLVETLRMVGGWPARIYLGFATVLLAPVAEEVLFRGILYGSLKQMGFPKLALLGSSAFFAFVHLNVATFLPLMLLAAACAIIYDRTGNLLAPIMTHVIFNAANIALLFLAEHFQP